MSERFFSDEPIGRNASVVLAGTDAHHLLHVMRLGVGQQVTLFDGGGDEFTAEVQSTTRRDVRLAIVERHAIDRESPVLVTMGIALPKGDRQKMLVEKLTEIGVARLVPLVTEHAIELKGSTLKKLRRGVIEASKQCRRNRLMQITEPTSFKDFLAENQESQNSVRLIAHPTGGSWSEIESATEPNPMYQVAIGPEGGFSDEEYQAALDAGWLGIGLGERILRIETTAIGMAFRLIQSQAG